MNRFYQLIIPLQLQYLLNDPKKHKLVVIVLSWVINELYREYGEQLNLVDVEVIRCTPHAPYTKFPALGIHYTNPDKTQDLSPLVEQSIDKYLKELPAERFISFIANNDTDWIELTNRIMTEGR